MACAGMYLSIIFGSMLATTLYGAHAEDQPPPNTCTEDAMLVFDASGSMASAGYNELETPRIFYAIEAARTVLPQVTPYRKLGLIVLRPCKKRSPVRS